MPMTYDEIKFSKPQRKRSGEYFNCEFCGKQFYLTPSQAKQHKDSSHKRGRFCSRKCQRNFHAIVKTCPICNKEFSVPRGISNRYTVCSWKCRASNMIEHTCVRCGKVFRSSEKRWKPKYCSEECRRPPEYIRCKTCGTEFRKLPSDDDRQFCSFSCYRKSNSETKLEEIVRNTLDIIDVDYIQEYRCGRYSIDFFIPADHIAFECDGKYWHQDKNKEKRRDDYLKSKGLNVIHLTEKIIKSGDIDNVILSYIKHFL